MIKDIRYCPECIILLTNNSKKLGRSTRRWLVCSQCGYREKLNNIYSDKLDKKASDDAMRHMNNNLELYDECR